MNISELISSIQIERAQVDERLGFLGNYIKDRQRGIPTQTQEERIASLREEQHHLSMKIARARAVRSNDEIANHELPLSLVEERKRLDSEKHELEAWLETIQGVKHISQKYGSVNMVSPGKPPYRTPTEPTFGQWHTAALDFVNSGSVDDYDKMLSRVSLDHAVPNLWNEGEKLDRMKGSFSPLPESRKPFTQRPDYSFKTEVWHRARPAVLLIVAVFIFLIAFMWAVS